MEINLLSDNQVHVYSLYVSSVIPQLNLKACWKYLSDDDKKRFFRSAPARQKEIVISRCFLWRIINKYLPSGLHRDFIRIRKDHYGKPFLYYKNTRIPLYFNLSHTKGLMCCVVSLLHPLGIDAEFIDKSRIHFIANYFTNIEKDAIKKMQVDQDIYFYKLWILKEAFLKADGRGLSIDLDSFWFEYKTGGSDDILLHFSDNFEKRWNGTWFFEILEHAPAHITAIAVMAESRPIITYASLSLKDIWDEDGGAFRFC